MTLNIWRAFKGDSGASLTELSVVVTALGGVSAAAIVALTPLTANAETVACKANQDTVQVAGLAFLSQSAHGVPASSMSVLVRTGYLREVPPNVSYTVDGTSYKIVGTGPCAP